MLRNTQEPLEDSTTVQSKLSGASQKLLYFVHSASPPERLPAPSSLCHQKTTPHRPYKEILLCLHQEICTLNPRWLAEGDVVRWVHIPLHSVIVMHHEAILLGQQVWSWLHCQHCETSKICNGMGVFQWSSWLFSGTIIVVKWMHTGQTYIRHYLWRYILYSQFPPHIYILWLALFCPEKHAFDI